MRREKPFDAVLLIAYGGPRGMDEVRPFLERLTRGRLVSPERLEQAVGHYELFDGVSPLTEITLRQAAGLEERLKQKGIDLPVHVGMRHWHPYIADTLAEIAAAGVRRAIGFIAAPHYSQASYGRYKESVLQARKTLVEKGRSDVAVTYVDSWFDHPLFDQAWARRVHQAMDKLEPRLRQQAHLIFTAHSLPISMASVAKYQAQLAESSRLVAKALGQKTWDLVYQSRSGRPTDAWLEPDICDHLRAGRAQGWRAVVIVPIGFVCEHIELLYDLDREAAAVCDELNLPMARAEALNDAPIFLDMMADVVERTYIRHRDGHPLPSDEPETLPPPASP